MSAKQKKFSKNSAIKTFGFPEVPKPITVNKI